MIEYLVDLWRRYWVANEARILRIELSRYRPLRPAWRRCANSTGFNWLGVRVYWRIPYSKMWAFDGERWVPAYLLSTKRGAA